MPEINQYIKRLTDSVYRKISDNIFESDLPIIVSDLIKSASEKDSITFHKYYVKTTSIKDAFISSNNFFRHFKQQYSLQGISNSCLDKFEESKQEILRLIEENELSELYFNHFFQVKMTIVGDKTIVKSFGSFFTKLVHTFNPSQYCALDNPIKDYFGLKNESFFISFIIISDAYKKWAVSNTKLLSSLRESIIEADRENHLQISTLTDLKLFDLIFRIKANPQNNIL